MVARIPRLVTAAARARIHTFQCSPANLRQVPFLEVSKNAVLKEYRLTFLPLSFLNYTVSRVQGQIEHSTGPAFVILAIVSR